ncbi:MAG: hypothetical protein A2136_05410 [Chloroflexi bacterium RBG_16_54_11]|nr:MAG: hypothetical protein A2136_05410 [Chloroflexi bacterium RBG_16_54_11]
MRTGTAYRRETGPIAVSPKYRLIKDPTQVTYGQDYNRNTTGTFNRHSGGIILSTHFVLKQILWDVLATGTYDVLFVSDLTNSPTVLYTVGSALSLTGAQENTITCSPEILLRPGYHFLSLLKSGGAVQFYDHTGVFLYVNTYLSLYNTSYNGGSSGNYSLPIKFVGYLVEAWGAVNYMPAIV